HHTTCCYTDCTAAPEPQERIDPIINSPPPLAVFLTREVAGVIKGGILVVILVVIAAVWCRKKINSGDILKAFKSTDAYQYAVAGWVKDAKGGPSPRGSQPWLRFSPYHTPPPSRGPRTSGTPAPPRVWTQRGKRLRAGGGRLDHL
ncbi:unnamed protein product, partial [Gadus morhua 'NCC']